MLPARRRPHPLAAVTLLCLASATIAWFIASFAMRRFQPGGSIVAAGYLLLSREIPEDVPPAGQLTERHA